MKAIRIIIPTLMTVISIVAIVLSGVTIGMYVDNRIMDAEDIGLTDLLQDEVLAMSIYGNAYPTGDGEFHDEEFLNEFLAILSKATFQVGGKKVFKPNAAGEGYNLVEFCTAKTYYSFYVLDDVLVIGMRCETYYYNSNMTYNIAGLINDKYSEYLHENLPLVSGDEVSKLLKEDIA